MVLKICIAIFRTTNHKTGTVMVGAISYNQKIWLLNYNVQLKMAIHGSSKVKKKNSNK